MQSVAEYCEILGIDPSATPEQFKQAYRDLVKVWHPDRFSHDPRLQRKAEEKLKEINEAYEQLQSYFSNNKNRRSQQSHGPRSEQKREHSKTQEPPPKPPPNPTKQQEITPWLKKWWLPATFVLLIGWNAITDWLHRPVVVPDPTPSQQQRSDIPTDPSKKSASGKTMESDSKDLIVGKPLELPQTAKQEKAKASSPGSPELVKAHKALIKQIEETRANAEKLLAIHEGERQRYADDYSQRRNLYLEGSIGRNEVFQSEQGLIEAMRRIDEDKRWIAESDNALLLERERLDALKGPTEQRPKNKVE